LSSIYEVPVDPNMENNSHAFVLSFVGYNKSVLEVGCSSGYITKILAERGCDVIGIEVDPDAAKAAEKWAERVVVGNIDEGEVWHYVKDESFDVVLLGDVLEHLHDPLASLREAVRKVKPSGFVVTSLPNVAHGDVRMSLMQGQFRYSDKGLLDRTHLKFFTLESARELLTEAGLLTVETKRVVVPLFSSEIGVKREDVSHETVDGLLKDPEAETYQWVVKSVRDSGTRSVEELSRRVDELSDYVHREKVRTAVLRADLGLLQEQQGLIEALQGHAAGLEHNIEVLTEALGTCENARAAVDAKYQAVLGMRTVQMTAPIRWVYNKITRAPKQST
jgi:2-polyprenyl-3-methyl-5-hydroxy-6-metoxy-1,4-benzoquinol methylase